MADTPRPPKKVVKRVVKKPASGTAPTPPAPTMRYGRPASPSPKPQLKATPPLPKATSKPAKMAPQRSVDFGKGIKAAGSAVSRAGSAGWGGVSRGVRAASATVVSGAKTVTSWRIPHIEPWRASVITGLLVGLLAVGLGALAKVVFSEVRGVAGGGGTWGSLTFVVVAFVAFIVGERLLAAFGSKHAVVASLLGTVLAITAILAVFLDVSDSTWALLLLPVLAAATYAFSHWLLELADREAVTVD